MTELSKEGWAAVGSIVTLAISSTFTFLYRKMLFRGRVAKEDREQIAESYGKLLDAQQKRIDTQQLQIDALAGVVEQNRLAHAGELREQEARCDAEIEKIKEEHQVLRNELADELRQSKRAHARCEEAYAETRLELKAIQLRLNLNQHGTPGSPPA